ncbi:MAG: helix-turn-helix domain-containing protein [Cytophagales bacterium]
MNISIDNFIAVLISGFGIILCLSIGILLLNRKNGSRQSNRFLGLLLILYSLTLFNSLMAMTGVFSTYQHLYFLPLTFSLSIGPLFYFFVKTRIQPSFIFKYKHLLHFILPGTQFLFYLSIGFRSVEFKSWMWINIIAPYGQYVEETLSLLLGVGYLIAAIRLINREMPIALWKHPVCNWLRKFAFSLLMLLSISIIYEVVDWVLWNNYQYNLFNTAWADFPLKLSYAAISVFIGYHAFIYQNQSIITPKYFSAEDKDNLEVKINHLISKDQVFLDPELSLAGLSKMLDVPKNKLSEYFSSNGQSFRSFINNHRVDHFSELIQQGKHEQFSFLGLALESGFNSKASFNRIFKEAKGMTPSDFIKAG